MGAIGIDGSCEYPKTAKNPTKPLWIRNP